MLINPIKSQLSFGNTVKLYGSSIGGINSLWDETKKTYEARMESGADIPPIGHGKYVNGKMSDMYVEYEVEGDHADVDTNPIEKKHFQSLFKNLFALDRAGIIHNDFSLEHLYFADSGKVEIDGFRNSAKFNILEGPQLGEANMPSNVQEFEENGLYQYVSSLKSEKDQVNFLREYLQAKSDYHLQRADYLMNTKGYSQDDVIVQDELVKALVLSKPDKKVIDFELSKLNMLSMGDKALEFWKIGYNSTDRVTKLNQKKNSVLLLFDCLKYGLQLRDAAGDLAVDSENASDARYFELETAYMNRFNEELFDAIKAGANKILTRKQKVPSGAAGREAALKHERKAATFNEICSKIDINEPYFETKRAIDAAYSYFGIIPFGNYKDFGTPSNYAIMYANYS